MLRAVEDIVGLALLHQVAVAHYHNALAHLGHDAQVVADKDKPHAVAVAQLLEQLEDLLLHGNVEGGGGFVGDEQLRVARYGHGNHHPLALAAAEFVGIRPISLFWIGEKHLVKELQRALLGLCAAVAEVLAHHLVHLLAAADGGVERRHRLLKDHGNLAASNALRVGVAAYRQLYGGAIGLGKRYAAAHPGGGGQQPHHRKRADGLARARFAH